MLSRAQIRELPCTTVDSAADLRRLPARHTEPPFDDDVAVPSRSQAVQGALALAFALPSGVPAIPAVPNLPTGGRRLRLVPALADDFGPRPTARDLLPEPRLWAGRLVQAVVEVTVGARPVAQLLRWTTTDVYDSVRCRVARSGAVAAGVRRAAPRVRSVHVSEPRDGVAEVCAVVQHGPRCRAVALRLEGLDGRWQCTALQVC
jgi:hypothetical protein